MSPEPPKKPEPPQLRIVSEGISFTSKSATAIIIAAILTVIFIVAVAS